MTLAAALVEPAADQSAPMGERTFDAHRMNHMVNHPAVRPHVGGDPAIPLDFSAAIANRYNHFLAGDHGGFACIWTAPDTYEIHTFVLPVGRGQWAASFAMWGRQYLVDQGARHLWTMVHPDAANVRAFTLKAGFRPAGSRVVDLGAGPVPYDIYNWKI
ncbi:hypothetical protein [Sphingopyxis sp. GC21]|uniref:hypothetical protein n=1 Tax=Sphingopyxis sp. GC21 TaxID=2933562 RepID=UPI0021E36195|nr:hypothetical protein [Sphingopyxis sp. GC21]